MARINNKTIWILTANSAVAKIYATNHLGGDLMLIKEVQHPESQFKTPELISDRPGHFPSRQLGHAALYEKTNPKEIEAERFAHRLAEELEKAKNDKRYDELVIIAPPHFQGLLNKYYSQQVLTKIINNIKKDYTKVAIKELATYLSDLPKG